MIGISCTAFSSGPVEECLDKVVGNFEAWEIFSEAEHSIVHNFDTFNELLPSYDLYYSVHAPICDINVACIYESIREASLKETIDTMKAANALDIDRITVHPGLSSFSVHGIDDRYLECAKKSMKSLDEAAKEYNVTVAVENMPKMYFFLCSKASDLENILEGTDLSVCFDIGHANTAGQIDAMIDTFGDRIANIHIHDNNGDQDSHLTIGEGSIDFDSVLSKLSFYDRNYIIESKTYESALESHSVLDSMLSS